MARRKSLAWQRAAKVGDLLEFCLGIPRVELSSNREYLNYEADWKRFDTPLSFGRPV